MDNSLIVEGLNIADLSDGELVELLRELGFNPGPIVATTRSVYQRKLARLLRNETFIIEFEDNDVDEEVCPSALHSTMISPGPSYRSRSPSPSFSPPRKRLKNGSSRRVTSRTQLETADRLV